MGQSRVSAPVSPQGTARPRILVGLPAEIRSIVFLKLFEGAVIQLERRVLTRSRITDQHGEVALHVFLTCRKFHQEATTRFWRSVQVMCNGLFDLHLLQEHADWSNFEAILTLHVLEPVYGLNNSHELRSILPGIKLLELGNFKACWSKIEDKTIIEKWKLPNDWSGGTKGMMEQLMNTIKADYLVGLYSLGSGVNIFKDEDRGFRIIINTVVYWDIDQDLGDDNAWQKLWVVVSRQLLARPSEER